MVFIGVGMGNMLLTIDGIAIRTVLVITLESDDLSVDLKGEGSKVQVHGSYYRLRSDAIR